MYAVLFAFIWITYAAADYATEVFGSIWGRHNIRVWGIGDMNTKSWEGFAAGFVCALLVMVAIAWSQQLPPSWYVLALVLAVVNPIVELVVAARHRRLHDGDRERPRLRRLRVAGAVSPAGGRLDSRRRTQPIQYAR